LENLFKMDKLGGLASASIPARRNSASVALPPSNGSTAAFMA
jgi:hypothetical protein